MLDKLKKRLIYFETDGNIISDFVASRLKKAGMLRRVTHSCFYMQCVSAVVSCAAGIWALPKAAPVMCAAACLVIGAAFLALGGSGTLKIISLILNLVSAVVCFILGGFVLIVCGCIMLLSAAAALAGIITAYLRTFLLEYSPLKITRADYTLTEDGDNLDDGETPDFNSLFPPPPPPETELKLLADRLAEILNKKENNNDDDNNDNDENT